MATEIKIKNIPEGYQSIITNVDLIKITKKIINQWMIKVP